MRIFYLLNQYPQLSETYIQSEMDVLKERGHALFVASVNRADHASTEFYPYKISKKETEWIRMVRKFKPDVLHSHWMVMLPHVHRLARETSTPFTLRSHSFDVLGAKPDQLEQGRPLVEDPLCLGILAFPQCCERLRAAGYPSSKIVSCFPVVNFSRFHNEGPNGNAILNLGACLPKKRMEDFLELARRMPDRQFNLYAMGYETEGIQKKNQEMGSPADILPTVPHIEMPQVYKRHEWLVYTACPVLKTVGWPLAAAEAQAAGVGICMPRIRPDLEEYVGEAGYLFDSLEEAAEIIRNPFPEEKRRRGFELAKRSDIAGHITKLADLWAPAQRSAPASSAPAPFSTGDLFQRWFSRIFPRLS